MRLTKTIRIISLLAVLSSLGLSAQAPASAPPPPCSPADAAFVCGLLSPEDLVTVPGNQWVIAGAFSGSGGIYLIRAADRSVTVGYPSPTAVDRFDAKAFPGCTGPPDAAAKAKYQTHDLSLRPGANGVHRLLAVLHGPRESIEVFEVVARKGTPTLTWIGCAVAPDPIGLNSVRWLSDGGFIATKFLARGGQMKALQSGEKNGELWEWHTATGWQKVPGSEASGVGLVDHPHVRSLVDLVEHPEALGVGAAVVDDHDLQRPCGSVGRHLEGVQGPSDPGALVVGWHDHAQPRVGLRCGGCCGGRWQGVLHGGGPPFRRSP